MKTPRRIAYYLVTSGFGGVEQAALDILRELDRREFNPVVYLRCTRPEDDARMRTALAELNVPVKELNEDGLPRPDTVSSNGDHVQPLEPVSPPASKRAAGRLMPAAWRSAWYSWNAVRATAQVFRQEAFDAIHFLHGWYPSLELAVIASAVAKIPVRISDVYLEPESVWPQHGFHRWLIHRCARSATRVRAMYPRMRDQLVSRFRISPARIDVVTNWVDAERFAHVDGRSIRVEADVPEGSRVVVVPARLSEEKGHRVLFRTIAALNGRFSRTRYLLAGDGPLHALLRQEATASGLGDRVTFLGFRDDMPRVLAAADLVVLPSFKEGFPGVLLEAMAAGKPVIATDVGGVSELFQLGAIGRLVRPGDSEDLRSALEALLSADHAALTRMGQTARAVVEQTYARQDVVRRMTALYDGTDRHA